MDKTTSRPKHSPSFRVSGRVEEKGDISIKARLWLDVSGETFLAPGRVTLLERIDEYGSITKAAKSMEMSYRHAWLLVEDINKKSPEPLIVRTAGGRGGGGTFLTSKGKETVREFNRLQKKLKKFIESLS